MTFKLRSRLRSAALVEDARQETFVRVLTSLKRKRGLSNAETLGAFVNAVCNNVVFEMYRSGARTTPLPDAYDAVDCRKPDPDAALAADAERALVKTALDGLPQKDRALLHWLF